MSNSDLPVPQAPPEGTFKVVVGSLEAPLAELIPCALLPQRDLRPVPIDASVRESIGNMIRSLPAVMGLGIQETTQSYILKFTPAVTAQLQAGNASIMPALDSGVRAIAVNAHGRIIGNGTLVAAPGLSSIATAAILWQTLAMLTAQHYLHDMQAQLRTLREELQHIQDLLMAKEHMRLIGHERYVQRIVDTVKRGAIRELDMAAISVQLEQMERECDEVQALMYYQMHGQVPHMQSTPIWAWFPWEVERNVAAAQHYVDVFDAATHTFVASIRVKAMLAAVRAQLFHQTQISLARLKEAGEESRRGYTLIVQFSILICARGKDLWASTDLPGFLNGLRQTRAQWLKERASSIDRQFDQLGRDLSTTQRQIVRTREHLPQAVLLLHDPDGTLRVYEAPQERVSPLVG